MTPATKLQENINETSKAKEQNLRSLMRSFGSVLVAYSGGVDSSYLGLIATQELGANALCITGISPSVSIVQREQAEKIAEKFGFNHETVETVEIDDPSYTANPVNRCYFCKTELYGKLAELSAKRRIGTIVDGSNLDDMGDFRPGKKAAGENGVRSVLAELGFTKQDIRDRSKAFDLETWDKPSSPCLASRIQYGVPVSIERLNKVEKGETILRDMGFVEFRVRHHDELARIEIAKSELDKALNQDVTDKLSIEFQQLGFKYVTLDLTGFRSGAMNEVLPETLTKSETDSLPKKVDN